MLRAEGTDMDSAKTYALYRYYTITYRSTDTRSRKKAFLRPLSMSAVIRMQEASFCVCARLHMVDGGHFHD